jgi:hypothetical protein
MAGRDPPHPRRAKALEGGAMLLPACITELQNHAVGALMRSVKGTTTGYRRSAGFPYGSCARPRPDPAGAEAGTSTGPRWWPGRHRPWRTGNARGPASTAPEQSDPDEEETLMATVAALGARQGGPVPGTPRRPATSTAVRFGQLRYGLRKSRRDPARCVARSPPRLTGTQRDRASPPTMVATHCSTPARPSPNP